jgi:hypothetical protein
LFVAINVVGEVANAGLWLTSKESRISLDPSYLGIALGSDIAAVVGSAVLLVIAAIYTVSLFGLLKRLQWAPLLVITISLVNRALTVILFVVNPALAVFAIWTIIIVGVAYLDYSKLSTAHSKTNLT